MISQELSRKWISSVAPVVGIAWPAGAERREPMRIRLGATGLIAATLAGCASTFNIDPITAPRKFQFLRCEDIAKSMATAQKRERELRDLMGRAGDGVGGSTVNVLVYAPDLRSVQSELSQMREMAGEKRCSDEVLKAVPKTESAPPR
jgi:hypothetical protein